MNQDEFIEALVQDNRRRLLSPSLVLVLAVVAALFVAALFSYLFLGVEAGWLRAHPIFILKIVFVLSIVVSALSIVRDLSCPGLRIGWQIVLVVIPFVAMAVLSANEALTGYSQSLLHRALHASVATCLWHIGLLAAPAFVILVLIVRSLAPVDLPRAGLFIGLLSGAIGAFGYAFHCHENLVSFVGVSYSLAILQMGLLGSLLGPRLLRWS